MSTFLGILAAMTFFGAGIAIGWAIWGGPRDPRPGDPGYWVWLNAHRPPDWALRNPVDPDIAALASDISDLHYGAGAPGGYLLPDGEIEKMVAEGKWPFNPQGQADIAAGAERRLNLLRNRNRTLP